MIPITINGFQSSFSVRRHTAADGRFYLSGQNENGHPVQFMLTRTTTGNYVLQGKSYNHELQNQAYWLGKSCEVITAAAGK